MTTKPRNGTRILLLGGDADHNVGDRAILSALVDCIRSQDGAAEIAVVGEPSTRQWIPGIARTIPRGARGIAELLRYAFDADRVLVAGGGLFQDDDSRAKMPYWAARIALLRTLHARLIGHAIGAGPLAHAESRLAARIACAALSCISVRDRTAREALAACTTRPIEVVPDPAFMLNPAAGGAATRLLQGIGLEPDRPLVAVTVRRWFHARGGFVPNVIRFKAGMGLKRDDARFASLLDAIAEGVARIARRLGAGVLLLPGYNVGHEADDDACRLLARRLDGVAVRLARIEDPRLYQAVLGQASLVMASRMHPLILAAGMGIPIVALSYHPKFDGLFELLGLVARPLVLDGFPDRWDSNALVAGAETAMNARTDLRHRAALLGAEVRRQTLAVVFGDAAPSPLGATDA